MTTHSLKPEVDQVWEDGIDPVFWKVEGISGGIVVVRMHLANMEPTATLMNIDENRWRTFVDRQAATLQDA